MGHNSDLNTNYPKDYHLKHDQPKSEDIPEESGEKDRMTFYQPRNKLDWKVNDVGVNYINYPQSLPLYKIHNWAISVEPIYVVFDTAAFAKWVRKDAENQRELTQLEYIQERIEKDRANKAERLELDDLDAI